MGVFATAAVEVTPKRCRLGEALDAFDDADLEEFRVLAVNNKITRIERVMDDVVGFRVGYQTIRSHVHGLCACDESAKARGVAS